MAQPPGGGRGNGQPVIITGKVVDQASGQPLEYATITLFASRDSSLVGGGVTDTEGRFSIDARPGRFYMNIAFISYEEKYMDGIGARPGSGTVDLGIIGLKADATTLDEIEVRAEKSQVQMSLDKKIFNVGKDLANQGGSAADILDNVPSVTVDVEGNVSLRGSGGVRILINGKPSGMVGISDAGGLRNLPSNLIERVEVITNPSARYEAEGMVGIINIVLKKERTPGFNGSFDFTTGYPHNYGVAGNVNYRKNSFNLFASYGIRYRRGPGTGALYQEIYRNDTTFILDQISDRERGGWSHNFRLGTDWYITPKAVLTASGNVNISRDDNFAENIYRDYIFNLSRPTGITVRTDNEIEEEPNQEYSLTFRKTFSNKQHQLVLDARYQDNFEEEFSDLREQYYTPLFEDAGLPELRQRSDNAEGERMLILQADYVHPISKEGKVEFGYRSSFRDINTSFLVEELGAGGWETLAGLSNDFNYDEDIYAVYGIYGNKFNKFSVQLGVRLEYSDILTELVQTNEVNPRDYLNLFPSAHLTYDLPNQNGIQLSYSRRITRPRFWTLNPFLTFSDARNFFAGNPNLNPEFSHSVEVGHLKYWEKGSMTSSLYYRHTDGVIERIQRIDNDSTSTTIPENLATEDAVGLEVTFSYSPYKWLDFTGNVNAFNSRTDGSNIDESLTADATTLFGRLMTKVDVKNMFDAQLRFNYRAPRQTTQGRNKAIAHVDLGFSRDVLKNKGTVTLSVRDLFNSRRRRYIAEGANFYREGDWQWRARQVQLTLNYRLNQNKRRGGQRDFEGGGDEGGF
jgi:outer membrane receptor protein involved in Fe transport